MKTASCHAFALLLAGLALSHAQDGSTRTISTTGTAALGLAGNFSIFSDPVLNGSGVVSFRGSTLTDDAIYKTSGTGLIIVTSTFQSAPGLSSNFDLYPSFVLNESGTVAFSGTTVAGTTGVYTGSGGALTTIAYAGQTAPVLNTSISGFNPNIALSDSGSVAIVANATVAGASASGEYFGTSGTLTTEATTLQTAPGTGGVFGSLNAPVMNNTGSTAFTSTSGIYLAAGTTLTTVATTLQTAPEIGGTFTTLGVNPAINDAGTVAFFGIAGTGRGVFARIGGVLTAVASTARVAPGLGGANFSFFSDPALSNSGLIAFRGEIATGARGIYTGTGGALTTIAVSGQTAPSLGGVFLSGSSAFSKPAVNDLGTTAFLGTTSVGNGLYLGDGQQLVTVAYKGQSLSGGTVTSVSFLGGTDRGSSTQLNNNGQIAYKASLLVGGVTVSSIQLFTPTLHFRTPTSSAWTTRANWTLGIQPASVHDVVIDPAAALTVTGPMLPTTVKSLAINGTGAGVAELALQSTGTLTTTDNSASTGTSGRLSGSGKLVANLLSAGTIAPGLAASAGSITVTGNVTLQSTAHLAFDLGGLVRKTGYDFLSVSGALTLGGSLDVALLGGFVPLAGNTFDLFDSASVAGSFSALNLPVLTGGLSWNTTLLPTTGVISVAGLTVAPTTYTLGASASAATIHKGGSATITATITNTGAAGTDTLNFSSLNVSASPAGGTVTGVTLTLSNSALANNNGTQSGTATFSSTTAGTYTLTPTVASALNGTLGSAATLGGVTSTTVKVFSGRGRWNTPGAGAWATGGNWTDLDDAGVHAAPGSFAGFAASDTAVFDAAGGSSVVSLNGSSPSLTALTFNGGSSTLARGTGGTILLNNGASPATITDSAGSHSITAPVQLGSDAIATVASAADTLTLSGGLTGAGKTLTKTGAGKLVLAGVQNYAVLNLNGGLTDITGTFSGTAVIHANTATKFTTSQTLGSLTIADGVEVTFGDGSNSFFDDGALKVDQAVVPEPGAASLLLLGALGMLSRRRR